MCQSRPTKAPRAKGKQVLTVAPVDIFASFQNITWLGCEHISKHAAVFACDRSRQTATLLRHWQVRLRMQNWTSLQSQFCPYQHLGIQSETSDIFRSCSDEDGPEVLEKMFAFLRPFRDNSQY